MMTAPRCRANSTSSLRRHADMVMPRGKLMGWTDADHADVVWELFDHQSFLVDLESRGRRPRPYADPPDWQAGCSRRRTGSPRLRLRDEPWAHGPVHFTVQATPVAGLTA